jgi:carbon-monoxide dehydrogenase large subunit
MRRRRLAHLGVRHLDPPLTPERIWRAIGAARAGRLPSPWREPPAVFDGLPVRDETGASETQGADL